MSLPLSHEFLFLLLTKVLNDIEFLFRIFSRSQKRLFKNYWDNFRLYLRLKVECTRFLYRIKAGSSVLKRQFAKSL